MPAKQIQLSSSTLKKIAEALFLAYTAEQAAYLGGISRNTLLKIRGMPIWAEIEEMALEMEKPFRQKIYRGLPGWQGAAWMLERKYPGQLSKPEIQLQLNSTANTTNNTLIITAEQAEGLKARNSVLNDALSRLTPPANRQAKLVEELVSSEPGDPNHNTNETTLKSSVVRKTPPPSGGGTPSCAGDDIAPNLSPNSQNFEKNEPKITEKNSVENSRNYGSIPPEGIDNDFSPENPSFSHPKGPGPGRKYGPLGELLPSKREIRERQAALEAELREKKKILKKAAPPLPGKTRKKRVPPKIVLRPRVVKAMAGI